MNKDIHCLKKWDEVIIFNNEIFYTPPVRFSYSDRFKSLFSYKPDRTEKPVRKDCFPKSQNHQIAKYCKYY